MSSNNIVSPCFEDISMLDVFSNYDFIGWCIFWTILWYLLRHVTRIYFYPMFHNVVYNTTKRQLNSLKLNKKTYNNNILKIKQELDTSPPNHYTYSGLANAIYSLIHISIILILDFYLLFFKNNRLPNGENRGLWHAMNTVFHCGDIPYCKEHMICDNLDITALNKTMAYFLIDYFLYVLITNHRLEYMIHHLLVAGLALCIRYSGAGYPCLQYGLLTSEFGTMTMQLAWIARDLNKYYKKKVEVIANILVYENNNKQDNKKIKTKEDKQINKVGVAGAAGETRGRRSSVFDSSGYNPLENDMNNNNNNNGSNGSDETEGEGEGEGEDRRIEVNREELMEMFLRKDKTGINLEKWEFVQSLVFSLTFFIVRLYLVPLMCFKVSYFTIYGDNNFGSIQKLLFSGGLLLLAFMGFYWSNLLAKKLYRMITTNKTDSDTMKNYEEKLGHKEGKMKEY